MMYKIEYISTFYADVLNVVNNLEEYPQKAKRIFERLDKILKGLGQTPEMYQIYEDFPIFRKIIVEDYLVFYIVNKRDKIIEVHRLIYARMDMKKQLKL